MKRFNNYFLSITFIACTSSLALAQDKKSKKPSSPATSTPQAVTQSADGDDVVVGSSTRIDFSETSIDGKMKAPDGFFLQGRNSNSLSQMVKLRSNFRSELRNSRSAVKSHVK